MNELKRICPSLYRQALTHSSADQQLHNQRLEFLGDAVLSMVVSEWLYSRQPQFSEGQMSQIRAAVVREESLAVLAGKLALGEKVYLGKGEEKSGGRQRPSLLADTLEAVIAALFLTVGLEETRTFILDLFADHLQLACQGNYVRDCKTELQEQLQAQGIDSVQYTVTRESGPPHNRTFWVELSVAGQAWSTGRGKTKKQAEQEAARKALANRQSE